MISSYFDHRNASGQTSTPYWSPSTSSSTLSPLTQSSDFSSPNITNYQELGIAHSIQNEQIQNALDLFSNSNLFHFNYNDEKLGFDTLSASYFVASHNNTHKIKEKVAKLSSSSCISNDRNAVASEIKNFEEVKDLNSIKYFSNADEHSKVMRGFRSRKVWNASHEGDQKGVSDYLASRIPEQGRRRSKTSIDVTRYPVGSVFNTSITDIESPLRVTTGRALQMINRHLQIERSDQKVSSSSPLSTKRRRQRSKTNSIVYAMNNLPIHPFSAQFSQVERNSNLYITCIKDHERSIANAIEQNKFMRTAEDKQEIECETLQQAVETALKSVKSENDKDSLKRAPVGSKTREEQNREKSKRYYDRNKTQNTAITKMFTKLQIWCKTYGLPTAMIEEVERLDELIMNTKTVAAQGSLEPSQKTKLIKMLEKDKKTAQMTMIVLSAKELNKLLKLYSEEQIKEKIKNYRKRRADLSDAQGYSLDVFDSGLFVWIDGLSCWSDLILAEKRLAGKAGDRSIFEFICFLSDLYN